MNRSRVLLWGRRRLPAAALLTPLIGLGAFPLWAQLNDDNEGRATAAEPPSLPWPYREAFYPEPLEARQQNDPAAAAQLREEFLKDVSALLRPRWIPALAGTELRFSSRGSGLAWLWESRFQWDYAVDGSSLRVAGRFGHVYVWVPGQSMSGQGDDIRPELLRAWERYLQLPPPPDKERVFLGRQGWSRLSCLYIDGYHDDLPWEYAECAAGPDGLLFRAHRRSAWATAKPLVSRFLPEPSVPQFKPLNPTLVEYELSNLYWRKDGKRNRKWVPASLDGGATHTVIRVLLTSGLQPPDEPFSRLGVGGWLVPLTEGEVVPRQFHICETLALLEQATGHLSYSDQVVPTFYTHYSSQSLGPWLVMAGRGERYWRTTGEWLKTVHAEADLRPYLVSVSTALEELTAAWRQAIAEVRRVRTKGGFSPTPLYQAIWPQREAAHTAVKTATEAWQACRKHAHDVHYLERGWAAELLHDL